MADFLRLCSTGRKLPGSFVDQVVAVRVTTMVLLSAALASGCVQRTVGLAEDLATADLATEPRDLGAVLDAAGPTDAPIDLAPPGDLAASVADLVPPDLGPDGLVGNVLKLDGGDAPLGLLHLRVLDGDDDQPTPSMVVFRTPPGSGFTESLWSGAGTTPPSAATGAVVGLGVLGTHDGVMLVSGEGDVPVPAGTYTIFVTRGPEYEGVTRLLTIGAGETQTIEVTLDRSVDTGGWLAADLHVHTQRSFDSKILLQRRVVSMVAAGLELLVPTDHNVHSDLSGEIAALGYAARVGQVIGNEFNFDPGHGGAYPVAYDPLHQYGGAPAWTAMCGQPGQGINCYAAPEAFAMMHAQVPGQTFVTVNHPWWDGADLGFFTNVHWGAGTSQTIADLPGVDGLDGIEILNPYKLDAFIVGYLIEDWFALLDSGRRVLALGNSDSHGLTQNRAGYARNWIRMPTDAPSDVTDATLAAALQAGGVVASTGPFIRLSVDGADIGGTAIDSDGSVEVSVEVDAPLWIPLDRVAIYLNGVVYQELATTTSRPRLAATFAMPVPMGEDSYVVAIASSDAVLPEDVVGTPNMQSWAIANPVWIDGNAQRGWQRRPPRRMSGYDARSEVVDRVLHERPHSDDGSFEAWAADQLPRWFDP